MSPHEASHDEIWSYLTCCWLLDVAIWRWSAGADVKRFIGDVNRNTFRRMWWRAEIMGPDIDLDQPWRGRASKHHGTPEAGVRPTLGASSGAGVHAQGLAVRKHQSA